MNRKTRLTETKRLIGNPIEIVLHSCNFVIEEKKVEQKGNTVERQEWKEMKVQEVELGIQSVGKLFLTPEGTTET